MYPPGTPAPGPYPPPGPYLAPKPGLRRGRTVAIIVIVVSVIVTIAGGAYILLGLTPKPPPVPTFSPVPSASVRPTPTAEPPEPSPSAQTPIAPPSPQGPVGTYRRERENLTPVERQTYGNLKKGDCINEPGDLEAGVDTVPCSEPHTDQVMGFVDLSEGMPARSDSTQFEISVAQRCNSLRDTLPIPEGFRNGVRANYPDADEWADGVRAALCWVPVFNKTWVGSAIDGTAREV